MTRSGRRLRGWSGESGGFKGTKGWREGEGRRRDREVDVVVGCVLFVCVRFG